MPLARDYNLVPPNFLADTLTTGLVRPVPQPGDSNEYPPSYMYTCVYVLMRYKLKNFPKYHYRKCQTLLYNSPEKCCCHISASTHHGT